MSFASTTTNTKTVIKPPSMWKITLINDDFTPMEFVVQILLQIFHKSQEEALTLTMRVHDQGSAVVGLYTKDVATSKSFQVRMAAERYDHPLKCVAEEA